MSRRLPDLVALFFLVANRATTKDAATNVVKDYIRATYARDFTRAYRLISDKDKPMVSEANYVRERGAYEGFTLRLAKDLAANMDFSILEDARDDQRARDYSRIQIAVTGKYVAAGRELEFRKVELPRACLTETNY